MPFRIEGDLTVRLPDIPRDIIPAVMDEIGEAAVDEIQRPDSLWPVATGTSKRQFYAQLSLDGFQSNIRNRARSHSGFNYPALLERRHQFARRTINRGLNRILAKGEDVLRAELQEDA